MFRSTKHKKIVKNIYKWMVQCTAHALSVNVNSQVAWEVTDTILDYAKDYNSPRDRFDKYGPRILVPLAYAVATHWQGTGGLYNFSYIAQRFGISSLRPIALLQASELDEDYKILLEKLHLSTGVTYPGAARREVQQTSGYFLWLAYNAAGEVMSDVVRYVLSVDEQFIRHKFEGSEIMSELIPYILHLMVEKHLLPDLSPEVRTLATPVIGAIAQDVIQDVIRDVLREKSFLFDLNAEEQNLILSTVGNVVLHILREKRFLSHLNAEEQTLIMPVVSNAKNLLRYTANQTSVEEWGTVTGGIKGKARWIVNRYNQVTLQLA